MGHCQTSKEIDHENMQLHGLVSIRGSSWVSCFIKLYKSPGRHKSVNELSIENRSDQDIYVQAGDIVKGGQQDCVLAIDLIVPPGSGRMPIAAFCVESGRWHKREGEQAEVFSSSAEVVVTKDLKLAAKSAKSQGAVWENVTVAQDKLSESLSTRVNSTASESSLQLAVENRKVQETAAGYTRALA